MNDRNIKHVMGKKSPSPYPERKKKPRLKFSWNKEQTIDYSKSKQIDIFIQDVIEKAKEDYLQTYIQGNGQCIDHNSTDREDDNCHNSLNGDNSRTSIEVQNGCRQDEEQQTNRTWGRKSSDINNGRSSQDNIEMKELGKETHHHGERKPLIDKSVGNNCCSDGNLCSRLLTLLTCYHCRCLRDVLPDS